MYTGYQYQGCVDKWSQRSGISQWTKQKVKLLIRNFVYIHWKKQLLFIWKTFNVRHEKGGLKKHYLSIFESCFFLEITTSTKLLNVSYITLSFLKSSCENQKVIFGKKCICCCSLVASKTCSWESNETFFLQFMNQYLRWPESPPLKSNYFQNTNMKDVLILDL